MWLVWEGPSSCCPAAAVCMLAIHSSIAALGLLLRSFKHQHHILVRQGQGGVFLAGAWAGYGFHEDGIKSAVDAVTIMGALSMGGRKSSKQQQASSTHESPALAAPPWAEQPAAELCEQCPLASTEAQRAQSVA